jgi:hypothetical protein
MMKPSAPGFRRAALLSGGRVGGRATPVQSRRFLHFNLDQVSALSPTSARALPSGPSSAGSPALTYSPFFVTRAQQNGFEGFLSADGVKTSHNNGAGRNPPDCNLSFGDTENESHCARDQGAHRKDTRSCKKIGTEIFWPLRHQIDSPPHIPLCRRATHSGVPPQDRATQRWLRKKNGPLCARYRAGISCRHPRWRSWKMRWLSWTKTALRRGRGCNSRLASGIPHHINRHVCQFASWRRPSSWTARPFQASPCTQRRLTPAADLQQLSHPARSPVASGSDPRRPRLRASESEHHWTRSLPSRFSWRSAP